MLVLSFPRLLQSGSMPDTGSSSQTASRLQCLCERRIRVTSKHENHLGWLLPTLLQHAACRWLSSHVQLLPLHGTLASACRSGGHPRSTKKSRGHHIPEEKQPWFCISLNETLHPHHSLHFIAHLCRDPQAACGLLMCSAFQIQHLPNH